MTEASERDRNPSTRGWGARESAYTKWIQAEGVPLYTGSFVGDLATADVAPWPRIGQKGAIVNLAAQEQTDGWLMEIAPGAATEPLHHLFECSYYCLTGHGATTIWQPGSDKKQTVEWAPGALFSPPLNCYYQHFNLDGQQPTRLFSPTTAPLMMNALQDSELVFACDWVFKNRYNGADDYFSRPDVRIDSREWATNFIPDVKTFKLEDRSERGAKSSIMFFLMSGNGMNIHISEFPPGAYKKAHRHGPGAEIIVLNGSGYSLLWFPGDKERVKVDWKPGSIFSPRNGEYHQHFNTGTTPARYLAYTFGGLVVSSTSDAADSARMSEREGGWQIEYADEDPEVFNLFARECARNGAEVTIDHPRRSAPAG
jgi:gentisate 1,2-dioxygenase